MRTRVGQKLAKVFQGESVEEKKIRETFSWPKIKEYADKSTDDLLFECFRVPVIEVKALGIKVAQSFLVNCLGQKKYDQLMWGIFEWILDSRKSRVRIVAPPTYGLDCNKTIFRSLIENGSLRISEPMRKKMILSLLEDTDSADFFLQNRDKCRGWADFALYEKIATYKVRFVLRINLLGRGFSEQDIDECLQLHFAGLQELNFKEGIKLMREKYLTAEEVARYLKRKMA